MLPTSQLQIPFPFEGDEILYMEDITRFDHLLINPDSLIGPEQKITITAKKYCWKSNRASVAEALGYGYVRNDLYNHEDDDSVEYIERPDSPRNKFANTLSSSLQYHIKPLLLKSEGFLMNGRGGKTNCALLAFDSIYHKTGLIELTYTLALRDVVSPIKIVEAPEVQADIKLNHMRKPLVVVPRGETLEYNDTAVIYIRLEPTGKGGYHVIHSDRSMVIFYGPSTNLRKVGYRFCHIDPELQRYVGSPKDLWDSLVNLATPVPALSMFVRDTDAEISMIDDRDSFLYKLQKKFNKLFIADSINTQIIKSFQPPKMAGVSAISRHHACLEGVYSQLLGDSPQERIRKLTGDLRKQTSPALFNLYMKNMNNLYKATEGLDRLPSKEDSMLMSYKLDKLRSSNSYCKACFAFQLYRKFASLMLWLNGTMNFNNIKEVIGDEFLVNLIKAPDPGLKKQKRTDREFHPDTISGSTTSSNYTIRGWNDTTTSASSYEQVGRLRAQDNFNTDVEYVNSFLKTIFSGEFQLFLQTTLFRSLSEARKKSIIESFLKPENIKNQMRHNFVVDTTNMIKQFESHKKVEKGMKMLKGRDIRTLQSLHDELSFIINALNTEPKDINQDVYSFLEGKLDVPDTNFVLKIPKTNVVVKDWGNKQRHCIGSYAEKAVDAQMLLLGVWDKEKKDWFGHLSMDPIVIPEFFTTEKVKLKQACIRSRHISIRQFYGVGNSGLPTDQKQLVIDHMQKCLDEWFSSLAKELQKAPAPYSMTSRNARGQLADPGGIIHNQIRYDRIAADNIANGAINANRIQYRQPPGQHEGRQREQMQRAIELAHEENIQRQQRLDQLHRRNY